MRKKYEDLWEMLCYVMRTAGVVELTQPIPSRMHQLEQPKTPVISHCQQPKMEVAVDLCRSLGGRSSTFLELPFVMIH